MVAFHSFMRPTAFELFGVIVSRVECSGASAAAAMVFLAVIFSRRALPAAAATIPALIRAKQMKDVENEVEKKSNRKQTGRLAA